uniref:NADH-ubiquinone oxidoreductase chain 6 n=1 Tax=Boreus elegans TaxID=948611 RepID=E9NQ69_BOREL|nr:NADH dehydrogenase subunit 6 [Boreus elegans]
MYQFIIYIFSFIINMIFIQMNHPLSMGLILLIQTLLICLISGILTKTFWFSYILFLIFLGGMLVLFIYMTSLASNEIFSFSMNNMTTSIMIIYITLMFLMLLDPFYWNTYFNNLDKLNMLNNFIMNNNMIMLTKIYNPPTSFITLLLANYLFLTLIIVVKITNIFYGPLRQMN